MSEEIKSQNDAVLSHLQAGNRITPLEALNRFGCLRLGGRIYDLRQQGHRIEREMIKVGKKRVAQYWLEK